jgi:hypothetical protein
MKLTIEDQGARARLEPYGPGEVTDATSGSEDRRVPLTGEFVRIDGGGERLAKVLAVVWEPDGCITLELDSGPDHDAADDDACSDVERWFG